LCTIARYRDEGEQVRAVLGLERFVLYGQSWWEFPDAERPSVGWRRAA
jgi:hypothetical protein